MSTEAGLSWQRGVSTQGDDSANAGFTTAVAPDALELRPNERLVLRLPAC